MADFLVTGIGAADRLRGAARQGRIDAGTLDFDEIIAETKAELDLLLVPPEGKRPH